MLQPWQLEYRDIRLEIRQVGVDTYQLSKLLRFTAASMRKNQLKAIESKEEVREFERHKEFKEMMARIKSLRGSLDARPLFVFKQEMQQLYNQIAQKQETLFNDLQALSLEHDTTRQKERLKIVRYQNIDDPGQNRITERDQQVCSQEQQQSNQFKSGFKETQAQEIDVSALPLQVISEKIFKLGKYLGWKAGDHIQFMQILGKFKNNLQSQKFIAEASSKLALSVGQIIAHIQKLQLKNILEDRKREIIRQHKQIKEISKKAEQDLQKIRKEQAKAQSRQRSANARKASLQKKRQIEQYRKQKPIRKPTNLIPKR